MKKILLIEDNYEHAESIADILIMSGYLVSIVANGDKGQQSLFSYRPDLIISDISMPGMNGLELLDLLKRDMLYRKLPVILLSGKVTDEDVAAGMNAGADVYLKKPCDADELLFSVSQLIG